MEFSRTAEEQKGRGNILPHASFLDLKRNLGSIHGRLAANLGRHSSYLESPKLCAMGLDFSGAAGADNKVHLSFYPQPFRPCGQQPRLLAKEPAFILVRVTFGNEHWPAWLDVSFFSLFRGRWYMGATEPRRLTFSAVALTQYPSSAASLGMSGVGGTV